MDINGAAGYVLNRLKSELSPLLYYHCLEHTLDVLDATRRLSESEQIARDDRPLLETAALFHDAGMLVQYVNHETASARLLREVLPGFGYTREEMDTISRLIMVTKLPQRAGDHLEQVICDADLDYLGRDDFFINSFRLRLEWQVNGIRQTTLKEWFDIQVRFLSEHKYFTLSSINLRNDMKLKNLGEIIHLTISGGGKLDIH